MCRLAVVVPTDEECHHYDTYQDVDGRHLQEADKHDGRQHHEPRPPAHLGGFDHGYHGYTYQGYYHGADAFECLDDIFVLLECGEEQSEDIINLFNGKYSEKQVIYDFNNIDRIVTFGI